MGLTWTSPENAAENVRAVCKAVGELPFQGNFALAFSPDALEASLAAGLPIVTFSWGDPTPYLPMCRRYGASVGLQITSAEEIRPDVDFFIAQGIEAGGHVQSSTPILTLIESLRGHPFVAAGGLATGVDVRRVLDLGASGAMLGTRFVASRESLAHETYKSLLVEGSQTVLTTLFEDGWPDAPHRVLRNTTLDDWERTGRRVEGVVGHAPGGAIRRYEDTAPRVGFTGEIEAMCLYAGTGVDRMHDLPSAGEIVRRLARDAGFVV